MEMEKYQHRFVAFQNISLWPHIIEMEKRKEKKNRCEMKGLRSPAEKEDGTVGQRKAKHTDYYAAL